MSKEVKRPDLLIHALKGAIPGVVVPITKIEEATRLVEYIESLEAKLKIAEEALEFYADKENFKHRKLNGLSGFDCALVEEVAIINGEYAWIKAQRALAKIRGEG